MKKISFLSLIVLSVGICSVYGMEVDSPIGAADEKAGPLTVDIIGNDWVGLIGTYSKIFKKSLLSLDYNNRVRLVALIRKGVESPRSTEVFYGYFGIEKGGEVVKHVYLPDSSRYEEYLKIKTDEILRFNSTDGPFKFGGYHSMIGAKMVALDRLDEIIGCELEKSVAKGFWGLLKECDVVEGEPPSCNMNLRDALTGPSGKDVFELLTRQLIED